ncbi:DUF1588 domain-containing protein [Marinagarivorans algicola]|uniref:DUF1588 domain-containing protein n=1 Tax=Marinagarivorans algicola TaxID=1513270 RepID=UPI0009EC79B3|nr:DUF1588 domain-containing protein [Marinagarivorans algicola]
MICSTIKARILKQVLLLGVVLIFSACTGDKEVSSESSSQRNSSTPPVSSVPQASSTPAVSSMPPVSSASASSTASLPVTINAEKVYGEQCLACHGDKNGDHVELGGALTFFECGSCSTVASLAKKIEEDMPPAGVNKCDAQCAQALAVYIRNEFAGFSDTLTGQQLYKGFCVDCHGNGEEQAGLQGPVLNGLTCNACKNEEVLTQRISRTMPVGNSAACEGECASKIASYIRENFVTDIIDEPLKANLSQPEGFRVWHSGKNMTIRWKALTTPPDYWILDAWDYAQARWVNVANIASDKTGYTDNRVTGLYRLYAVTNNIASTPALARTHGMTIRSTGKDYWGNSDSGYFGYKNASGDFTAEVTVDYLHGVHPWTKAGLMVREKDTADARHVFTFITPSNGLGFISRDKNGGASKGDGDAKPALPVRLRIQRTGNVFKASYLTQGQNWKVFVTKTLALPSDVLVGLAQSSHTAAQQAEASYSGFTLDGKGQVNLVRKKFDAQATIVGHSAIAHDKSQVEINPSVGALPLSHLNRFEFQNSVNDSFPGNKFNFISSLNSDDTSTGFEVGLNTSALGVEKYLNAADTVGVAAAPNALMAMTCTATDTLCVRQEIRALALKILRAPIAEQTLNGLMKVYSDTQSTLDQQNAMAAVLTTLVKMPSAYYKFDDTGVGMNSDTLVPVTGYAMASRLAMTLWASAPDAQLLEAAAKGALVTPAQIKAQAERMVADPKAKRGFQRFYRQWLTLDDLVQKDKTLPGITFNKAMINGLYSGIDSYVESIVFGGAKKGTLSDLLTTPKVGNNKAIKAITGINTNKTQTEVVSTAGTAGGQRTGLLGQPAMLALLSQSDTTAIVHRGAFINIHLMCSDFPPPPENVPQLDSIDPAGKTSREVLDVLTNTNGCIDCHRFINPVGGALENFDPVGRYREYENGGVLINVAAGIYSRETAQIEKEIDGLAELNQYLAKSDLVKSCLVSQYLTFATGREPTTEDISSVKWLTQKMEQHNWVIERLLVEATQTPVFLYKKVK